LPRFPAFPRPACERDSGSSATALEMQGRRFREKVLAHFRGNDALAFKRPFSVALPSVTSVHSSAAGVRHSLFFFLALTFEP
jgi:hypothetical protein